MGQAENIEARESGETAEQSVPHQSRKLLLIPCARASKCGIYPNSFFSGEAWSEAEEGRANCKRTD
jgi:hypothetical protein